LSKPNKPNILILDIETAPVLAYVWRTFKAHVSYDQISTDWYILSFAAKWLHAGRVMYHDQSRKKDIEDDRDLMQTLHTLLDAADIVVAHNGKRFDVRKIKARFILNGLPPPSPFKVVDTLIEARREFAFTSNRLVALTDQLVPEQKKDDHKEFPGFELWAQCLKGNRRAWRAMRTYNRQDVLALEALYLKLRPWMTGHPNVAAYSDPDDIACPKCGSHNLERRGHAYTQTSKYQRYRCRDCGGWARGRLTQNSNAVRKNLLIN